MPHPPSFDQVNTPKEILAALVGFPTVSRDSNLPLIDWVAGWLEHHGIDSFRDYDDTGQKASLYAHVGPRNGDGGVILSGHVDVVPVDGQTWTSDPFVLTERDGRLYGRGACDMKGFDALALWAMAQAAASDRVLTRPLQIALTRDEEIGCIGAPPLLKRMVDEGFPKAAIALIGEPTRMSCVTGHKGGQGFGITARGYEVHSSIMHTGVSAIMEAARIIDWANARNTENATAVPSDLAAIFDPPWTTVHTGRISGGTAHNITAARCEFGVDFRLVPGEAMEDWKARLFDELKRVETAMQAIHPDTGFDVDQRFFVPPLVPEVEGRAEQLVRSITGDNGTHVVSYGTEAGHFQAAGYSAVVCGPGDIAQAHQPDEFLEADQLEAGRRFLTDVLEYCTT